MRDWDEHPELRIDPDNRWWRLYLQLLRESVRAGAGKWVTGYPDLHTGIDALSALCGPANLALDLVSNPAAIEHAMRQLTELWKYVVDTVSAHRSAGRTGHVKLDDGLEQRAVPVHRSKRLLLHDQSNHVRNVLLAR